MVSARSFLRAWMVAVAGCIVLVAGLNLLVDPYDVFGTPRLAGISRSKPSAKNHALLAKTYQEARARPVTVLIGSSSAHIGVDADAAQWPAAMRPVYNYGIPGGYATSTSLRTLEEAVTAGGVRNAVVFLDFQNFLVPEQAAPGLSEDERRFRRLPDGRPNPYRSMQFAQDVFLSLATFGALVDSVDTVAGQARPSVLNLAANGSSTEADFIEAARSGGMYDLFAQKDMFEVERADRLKQVMAGWEGKLPNLGIVRAMIVLARRNDVGLTLVLTPHHGDALDIYWRDGMWPRLEQLKVELTGLVAEMGGAVSLWDFMDYSAFNVEPVPRAGDRRSATKWFWEPTHFKKALGALMIQRMFGQDAPLFGARLTPDNVAARNAEVAAQRQRLVCEHAGPALLTALVKPIDDGCRQRVSARDPG